MDGFKLIKDPVLPVLKEEMDKKMSEEVAEEERAASSDDCLRENRPLQFLGRSYSK